MSVTLYYRAIAAPFDGPLPNGLDLDGESFSDDTDFDVQRSTTVPVLWHHDRDPFKLVRGPIGKATNWRSTPQGLVADVDLDAGPVAELISLLGVPLYVSTAIREGTRPVKAGPRILRWPIGELSITTSPQNGYAVLQPRTLADSLRQFRSVLDDVQRHYARRRVAAA